MNAHPDEQPRTLNCAALRTLHALQMKLRKQINDLMENRMFPLTVSGIDEMTKELVR